MKRCDEAMAAQERGNALVSDWKEFVLWFEGDEEYPAYLECQASYQPTNSDGWRIKARALSSLDRTSNAVACLEEALRLYSDDANLWVDQAGYLSDLKRYDEALLAFDRARSLNPNDADLWAEQARQLVDLDRYDEALPAFDHALSALARVPLDRPTAIVWHLHLSSVDTSRWQSFTVFVRRGDQRFERPLAALHCLLVGIAVGDRRATDDAAAPFRQHDEKSMIFIRPFDDH